MTVQPGGYWAINFAEPGGNSRAARAICTTMSKFFQNLTCLELAIKKQPKIKIKVPSFHCKIYRTFLCFRLWRHNGRHNGRHGHRRHGHRQRRSFCPTAYVPIRVREVRRYTSMVSFHFILMEQGSICMYKGCLGFHFNGAWFHFDWAVFHFNWAGFHFYWPGFHFM